MGIEPTTFSLGSCEGGDVSGAGGQVTKPPSSACTSACTSAEKSEHDPSPKLSLETLAETLAGLSPEQRGKLADLLKEKMEGARNAELPPHDPSRKPR